MEYGRNRCYMTLVEELREKYRARAGAVSRLTEARDLPGIYRRRDALRQTLRTQLEDPDLAGTAPSAAAAGVVACGGYDIEKWVLRTRAGTSVPVHLYLPADGAARHPAVLVTMGHWRKAKSMADNQRFCANLALRGIVACTFDPICQGERCPWTEAELSRLFGDLPEDLWMVGLHTLVGNLAYLLDKNVGALFVHEARSVLDFLCARPEVDAARVGVTGQSGGGTQACYLAALDDRVKLYAPIQCLSRLSVTLEDGIGDCEQSLFGVSAGAGMEQCDTLWAALPKPVLQSAGRFDFFSIEGVYSIEGEMTGVYRALGAQQDYAMRMADCGHGLSRESREHVYGFLTERFFGEAAPAELETAVLSEDVLGCLQDSAAAGQEPAAAYRRMLSAVRSERPAAAELPHRLGALLGAGGDRYTVEPLPAPAEERWFNLYTAPGRGAFCRLVRRQSSRLYVVAAPGDFRLEEAEASLLYVSPWAMETAYEKRTMGYDLETCLFNAAAVLGESLAAQRVRELRAAVDYAVGETGASELAAAGVGPGSVPLLLAASLDGRFQRTVLADCLLSFDDLFEAGTYRLCETSIVPGLLRVADLPDLCRLTGAAVFSPRRPDGQPCTPAEAAAEPRVPCFYKEKLPASILRYLGGTCAAEA